MRSAPLPRTQAGRAILQCRFLYRCTLIGCVIGQSMHITTHIHARSNGEPRNIKVAHWARYRVRGVLETTTASRPGYCMYQSECSSAALSKIYKSPGPSRSIVGISSLFTSPSAEQVILRELQSDQANNNNLRRYEDLRLYRCRLRRHGPGHNASYWYRPPPHDQA